MRTLERVAEHLTALGLRFRTTDGVISIGFSGDNTPYEAVIRARGPMAWVVVPTVSMVPRPRLEETIRVVNLLNARKVVFGGFWVDTGRSRVVFELAVAATDGPTRDQVDLAMAALSQVDDCFPMLAAVIWGGTTAEAALLATGRGQPGDEPPPLDMAV